MQELSQKLQLPKHLFPLGKSSVLGRLIQQMQAVCSEILVITSAAQEAVFQEHLGKMGHPIPLRLQIKKDEGFAGDFKVMAAAYEAQLLVTMGDLVFAPHVLPTIAAHQGPNVIVIDRTTAPHFDFRIIGGKIQKNLITKLQQVNPESFWPMFKLVASEVLRGRGKVTFLPSLFNLNTPQAYQQAQAYFAQHPEA
jgi:molybdopterin-guanine dinucleotide biosynthesis protein A